MYEMRIAERDLKQPTFAGLRLKPCIRRFVFLALVTLFHSPAIQGQQATNSVVDLPTLNAESIEILRKYTVESTDLDADTKQKIEIACVQALDGLKRISEVAAQAEQFKRDTDEVQQRVALLRQRLRELQSERTSPPADLPLPELEQEVAKREVVLAELKAALVRSEAEPSARANRRREIRTLLLSANQRAAELQKQLDAPVVPGEPIPLITAKRTALQVRRLLIDAEQPTLQSELSKYDAEDAADFRRLERDVRTLEVARAHAELDLLQGLLNKRRSADSAAAILRACDAVAATPELLKPHAEENIALAEDAHALSQPIEETRRKVDNTRIRLEDVQKQFAMTQQRVGDIGLSGSIGALLRRQRVNLPDLRRRRLNVHERKALIEEVQYKLFEYDDIRSESFDAALKRMLAGVPATEPAQRARFEEVARSLVEQRREYLDGVIRNYNAYLDALFELDATEQRLIRETGRYESYIDERVLWIRSNRTLLSSVELDASDTFAFDPALWTQTGQQLAEDAWAHPLIYGLGLCGFVILVMHKPQSRRELEAISKTAARGNCTKFSLTIRAAFLTLMMTVAWPGAICFLAWRMNESANGSQFSRAVSMALFAVARVYLPLEMLRNVCRPHGLADSHFNWPTSAIAVFRGRLHWATRLGLLIVFATTLLYTYDPEHGLDSAERICFVSGMLLLALLVRRAVRPDSGLFRAYLIAHPNGWLDRLKRFWYWGFVSTPLTLAGMTILGYYYTAQQLTSRLYDSFVFVVVVEFLRAFLQRLLLVYRRDISIQQARERRAADAATRVQTAETLQFGPNQIVPTEESQPNVAANTEQSQRLIRTGVMAASLVGMWLIWVDVLPALRFLDQWPVWTTSDPNTSNASATSIPLAGLAQSSGSLDADSIEADAVATESLERANTVTVADIGLALLIGIVTFVCARNIPGAMEISLLQRLPLDNSIRYAVTTVTSYIIVLFGIILAFNAISVGWSKVQWLATALTFGLAFGLQEIFANFVAGLILLFERPIRVGDVVTVDDVTGVVSRIRIRATTITNWDRKEYVIPNKEFITGRMLNWTLSDKTNRIVINVGIAYGSDVDRAKQLLMSTCVEHPLILNDPPTRVTFEAFGEHSLNLVVRTFLPDLDNRLLVIDELHTAINRAFHQAGIEIAFPQHDLHLRSIDQSLLGSIGSQADKKAA